MSDLTKNETATDRDFDLLTLQEIEDMNPPAAEAIKEMDPIEQEGAIEHFSKRVHEEFTKTVEEKRQTGASKLDDLLSKQQRSALKESGRSVLNSVKGFGRTVASSTKEVVGNAKEAFEEHQIEKRMREIHSRQIESDADLRAQAVRELQEEKAKETDDDPDVTVVA